MNITINMNPFLSTKAQPLLFVVIFLIVITVSACSPKIQQTGLRAPADIKIDGQTLEWPNNKLQAYNPTERIEYTVCNDDDNLYLTARTSGHNAIDKIMYGGLIFTVNSVTGKDTNNVSLTFPIITPHDGYDIVTGAMHYDHERFRNDSVARVKRPQLDSLLDALNKTAAKILKEIKVTGVKAIKDSILSIINANSIKAMGQFNRKMEYTYELAIPLKCLGLSIKNNSKFNYTIKLNGARLAINTNSNGTRTYEVRKGRPVLPPGVGPDVVYMQTTTNLTGEYTLAKK